MKPEPIYPKGHVESAFHLRYTWTGWPSGSGFPPRPEETFFNQIAESWESDGIRLLEYEWSSRRIRVVSSVLPAVSPVRFAARTKGRLQHLLRKWDMPVSFSIKLSMGTVGKNRRPIVERYIEDQVGEKQWADERFEEFLEEFTVVDETVDLSEPKKSRSGRYWYNLHLVLTTRERSRITKREGLATIRDWCFKIAAARGFDISVLSVMPDHLHLALRGDISVSPEEIALTFMNNLAFGLGQQAIWQGSYYIGTFGEYDMWAVRGRKTKTAES